MKAILPLLLFFVGSVFAQYAVRPCSFNSCPKGYNRRYVGNTGKEFECICERENISPCDKAKAECRYYHLNSCTTAENVCEPESMLELCDSEFLYPDACDRAAAKIRLREEFKDLDKKPVLCNDLKKTCLDGGWYARYSCEVLPKHCDIDTINELCEMGKVTDVSACIPAKKAKRKLEEEKTKYTCDASVFHCDKYSPYSPPFNCTTIPTYCGSESIATACYKGIYKNTTLCDESIKRSQYLTLEEVDEDKCLELTEQCNTGKVDACAQIPPVCGASVVAAMCRKSLTIKKTLDLKLMCKGVDISKYNLGCSDFSYNCESHAYGCKLAQQFCSLQTISRLCSVNYLNRDSEKCKEALSRYPPKGR